MNMTTCTHNTDPRKLVRDGTSQEQRISAALDPAYAPVDARRPAHAIVLARAYAAYLRFFDANDNVAGDWRDFFGDDVAALLAVAAVQDIDQYRANLKVSFDFLKDTKNKEKESLLAAHLGCLFSSIGSLARQLDSLKAGLPAAHSLRGSLENMVQTQLALPFRRLIAYHKASQPSLIADVAPQICLLGNDATSFASVRAGGLSKDWWSTSASPASWDAYVSSIAPEPAVYGSAPGVFEQANHIATHNLFTSIFDQFLRAYARIVHEAEQALEEAYRQSDHQPHYALFLAFLRLSEHARSEMNTLTQRHLDFYYREVLRLKEKAAQPSHAHLLIELGKHVDAHRIAKGELFKAGKDGSGIDAFFASNRDVVVNQAKVVALKTVYCHRNGKKEVLKPHDGRVFASSVANSGDGRGGKLSTPDQSWHPLFNKVYEHGVLTKIDMPEAEIGFALASHYLLLAEGTRTITVTFTLKDSLSGFTDDNIDDLICRLTSEKGWIEVKPKLVTPMAPAELQLELVLQGAAPAVTPYVAKTHGYGFDTDLPLLLVTLRHGSESEFVYPLLQGAIVNQIDVKVHVVGLKTLAVSNDFGPVDTSKPFQPFGASPRKGSALIVGSKEVFQKKLDTLLVKPSLSIAPKPYDASPTVTVENLSGGEWKSTGVSGAVDAASYEVVKPDNSAVTDAPDLTANESYSTSSRYGYVRLRLSSDFGQEQYQTALLKYLATCLPSSGSPPSAVVAPTMASLTLEYSATQQLPLTTPLQERKARFFHVAPFGHAEPAVSTNGEASLLPQFVAAEPTCESAELYIGISGLKPPQSLALLFQVADGTADPLSVKPREHLRWSYLCCNEWIDLRKEQVEDGTAGLLNSGIVTLAVPDDASANNTILPAGLHWVRVAAASKCNAVCRLVMVASQALAATFQDGGNDPSFEGQVLAGGTINKLDQPVAAVKKISQPFPTFGGRGAESPSTFYTRVSERLRHKDRAIALWDFEKLVLEAFPQLYRVKCLNHTQYEPDENGSGIYRELAPGHVTVVTIPKAEPHELRDPLRPYTSLGLLDQIAAFLRPRLSCFAKLHVCNPQFEEVQAEIQVRFTSQSTGDEAFYVARLRDEVTRFLSPWAFAGGNRAAFGGRIYRSALLNFVEERPYVDYVADFKLFHRVPGQVGSGADLAEVEGSTAVSVLVSVPPSQHLVSSIQRQANEGLGEDCGCEA